MIERLAIRNLILIEQADIRFGAGFNIITGETGSGKSAILTAIRLILGERSDTAWIRNGADLAIIDAWVRIKTAEIEGIELPDVIEIRRELHRSGRSRCFVNDQQISLLQLRQLLSSSIELVDQSSSQKIANEDLQRGLFDAFLGLSTNQCAEAFFELRRTRDNLSNLLRLQSESARDCERMQNDLECIETVNWQKGEEELLAREHNVLINAQELTEKLSQAAEFISEGASPILPMLKRFAHQLEQMQLIEKNLHECAEHVRGACVSLEESSRFIVSYVDRLESNPKRLDAIEQRIADIESLKRKFKMNWEEVAHLQISLKDTLAKIEHLDEEIAAAKKDVATAEEKMNEAAHLLSTRRKQGANRFEQAVLSQLLTMNLPHAKFKLELLPKEISENGSDAIEWTFSANLGQNLSSIHHSASGGELSRLLLAVKIALAGKESSSCLIFDEIDSNVGGKTAAMLGEQLLQLSKECQLICVTHFVQVAKCATHHFLVQKEAGSENTLTRISKLDTPDRLTEYARMTGIT